MWKERPRLRRYLRAYAWWFGSVAVVYSCYFALVAWRHGSAYAFSGENLLWFGKNLLFMLFVSGLVALPNSAAKSDD
jgi:hypothetical protein